MEKFRAVLFDINAVLIDTLQSITVSEKGCG